jgi:hypothetical protein
VEFWRLTRSVQERFVASTEGAAAPLPLAVRPLVQPSQRLVWLGLGGLGLLAAFLSVRLGFGDLNSRYALAPPGFIGIYAGCFTLSALVFLSAAAAYVSAHAVPYRPAVYLFPMGVIDARTPEFVVHPLSEQSEVRFARERAVLQVVLEAVTFEFPVEDAARAEHAVTTLIELRDRLANAGPESNARQQSLLDPLFDNGFKNPFSPDESLRKVLPLWVRVWPLLALVLGVLLGGLALVIRNHLSEGRLYAQARSADRSETYLAYLARGGQRTDVRGLLLPRAELRDAVQTADVAAIERFLATHADTQIKPEVEAALEQGLLKELALAQAKGSLAALNAFATRYARYPFLAGPLGRAIDARIQAAIEQLKPLLSLNQSRLLPFIERLLQYTAKRGPEVRVRFQQKPIETLASAEKALRQSAYFSGEQSLPGQYFDRSHQIPREAAAGAALIAVLGNRFPRDLLSPEPGPALPAEADPKPTVPTLLITYHTEMSGAFISKKPRLALSGIGVIGKATFEIPDDPEPLVFKLTVWRAPDLKTISAETTPADLYETMADEAMKRFIKKYLATLFAER